VDVRVAWRAPPGDRLASRGPGALGPSEDQTRRLVRDATTQFAMQRQQSCCSGASARCAATSAASRVATGAQQERVGQLLSTSSWGSSDDGPASSYASCARWRVLTRCSAPRFVALHGAAFRAAQQLRAQRDGHWPGRDRRLGGRPLTRPSGAR
jgi:hypothetical protein